MKRTMTFLACALILLLGPSTTALALEIIIDETPVLFPDAQPYLDEDGQVIVPLIPVAESLGLEVQWVQELRMAIVSAHYTEENSPYRYYSEYLESETLIFTPGSDLVYYLVYLADEDYYDEGYYYKETIDAPASIREGRLYVPASALADYFWYEPEWNAAAQTLNFGPRDTYEYDGYYDYESYLETVEIALGQKTETQWFDFTIQSVEKAASYGGYTAQAGHELYVARVTETCTFDEEIPMGTFDFELSHESLTASIEPLDPFEGRTEMMPDIFWLEPGESAEYVLVFEVPTGLTGITLSYTEFDAWGYTGTSFVLNIN